MSSLQAGNNSNHFLDLYAAAFFIERYFQFAAQGSVMARVGRDFISFGRSGTQSHGPHPHPDGIQAAGDAVMFAQRGPYTAHRSGCAGWYKSYGWFPVAERMNWRMTSNFSPQAIELRFPASRRQTTSALKPSVKARRFSGTF